MQRKLPELPVHIAAGANALHDFLAQVAALAEVERPHLGSFLRQIAIVEVDTVERDCLEHAQRLNCFESTRSGSSSLKRFPDGKHMLPEDYGALYLQFANALHHVDAGLKLGGPAFQGVSEDIRVWPDAQGHGLAREADQIILSRRDGQLWPARIGFRMSPTRFEVLEVRGAQRVVLPLSTGAGAAVNVELPPSTYDASTARIVVSWGVEKTASGRSSKPTTEIS